MPTSAPPRTSTKKCKSLPLVLSRSTLTARTSPRRHPVTNEADFSNSLNKPPQPHKPAAHRHDAATPSPPSAFVVTTWAIGHPLAKLHSHLPKFATMSPRSPRHASMASVFCAKAQNTGLTLAQLDLPFPWKSWQSGATLSRTPTTSLTMMWTPGLATKALSPHMVTFLQQW